MRPFCNVQGGARSLQSWGHLDKILLPGPGGGGNGQAYGITGRGPMPLSAHDLQTYARPQSSLPLNLMSPLNGVNLGAKNGIAVGRPGQHEQQQQAVGTHMSPSISADMLHANRSRCGPVYVCVHMCVCVCVCAHVCAVCVRARVCARVFEPLHTACRLEC